MNATLVDEGLSASRPVYHGYTNGFRDLALFFEGMERDWRGWNGDRTWESLEADEDRHQPKTGHGPQVMATLRNTAISILRLTGTPQIASGLRHHARDSRRPIDLLSLT